ncbi:MAG TPA: energy transducer TonB, partial [Vicinamibacteria bacterium]|nr:energy transducer TonB [Vicinamibacteria bacterium]
AAVPLVAGHSLPPPVTAARALPPAVLAVPSVRVDAPRPPAPRTALPRAARTRVAPILTTAAPARPVPLVEAPFDPALEEPAACTGCVLTTSAAAAQAEAEAPLPGEGAVGGGGGPAAPLRVGTGVRAPARLRYVEPGYPDLARRAGVQGEVVLECLIDAAGRVAQARVVKGVALLDAAALAAVRQWSYRPTLLNGVPVPVLMTVTVRFQLR